MENELTHSGLILEVSDIDYLIGADDKIEIPVNLNTKKFYYNQATKRNPSTARSCGLFGSAGALSDLTGIENTEEDWKRLNQSAIDDYFLSIPGGMVMYRAVDCVRNDWNTRHPNNKILSLRCTIGDEVFIEALQKGHSLVVGYKTSKEYLADSQDDGIIEGENFPKGGGHLVRSNFNNTIKIDDNYFGTKKYNTYTNNKIKVLKDNGVFFPSAYLFIYEKTMAETIRENIDLEGAKKAFDKKLWNGLNPREGMSRQEVMTVINKIIEEYELLK